MIESHGFDQRQRGAPKKRQQRHGDQHGLEAAHGKKSQETQQAEQGCQTHNHDALCQAIGEHAPDIRRKQAHQLHLGHQQTDIPGRKRQ